MERIIREHYEGPKPQPRIESGGRTMAFSVSEELFQRVKRYLAAHGGQSQRDFVIGLVTQGLALWEQGKASRCWRVHAQRGPDAGVRRHGGAVPSDQSIPGRA